MEEISAEELKLKAHYYAESGKDWHFHILTPQCGLNASEKYAFVLENLDDNEFFIHYADSILRELGKELAELFHGKEIIPSDVETSEEYLASPNVQFILDRARELNLQGNLWHHHLLSPYCGLNKHKEKWNLMLEDFDHEKLYEDVTDEEPTEDLKEVEALFSAQDF